LVLEGIDLMAERAMPFARGGYKACSPQVIFPLLLALLLPCFVSAAYEGFGTTTQAGNQGQVVEVTSLEDSGSGTLREALKAGETPRRIIFRVGGTIKLQRPVKIKEQSFITIDGSTAPSPGITLVDRPLYIQDSHDILITHIRVRHSQSDGLTIRGSHHVIVDHCSLTDAGDENIGITQDCHDVTVSWCIIGDTRSGSELKPKGVLIANFDKPAVTNVSLHHNLFLHESQRNPQISTVGLFDIRNNVIWHWRAYGIRMRRGARGNIINNVFKTEVNARKAILLTENPGPVYIEGNQGPENFDVNRLSTAQSPFSVATVSTDPVEAVEQKVLRDAGALPRDEIDVGLAGKTSAPTVDNPPEGTDHVDHPQDALEKSLGASQP
jgi:pectate lyase